MSNSKFTFIELVLTLQQDTTCHLLVKRVRLHADVVITKHPPVKHPVMLLMQATMFLAQPKRARLFVLWERINRAQANPRVTMLMQDTMFQAFSPNQPDRLCCWNLSSKHWSTRVTMLTQGLRPLLVRQADCIVLRIKHPPVKHPVMLLMQATMFLAQPKRARLFVLWEPIKRTQANPRATMLMQGTMFLAQPKRARLHVLLESRRQVRTRVPALQQDTTCPLLVRRVRLHAVRLLSNILRSNIL